MLKLKPARIESLVIKNSAVAPGSFRLTLESPAVARAAAPGQFVMIRSHQPGFPILNRPFSIHDTIRDAKGAPKGIEILYKVVGKGTELLSGLKPREKVLMLGPFGRGFSLKGRWDTAILIAGGIGLAPFPLLTRKLLERKSLKRIILLYGVRKTGGMIPLDRFSRRKVTVRIASEQGGGDFRGMVTEMLEDFLAETALEGTRTRAFACGPEPMLSETFRIARKHEIRCQVSLETVMACGFGVCLGCVHKIKEQGKDPLFKKVCLDGPVFNGEEVVF